MGDGFHTAHKSHLHPADPPPPGHPSSNPPSRLLPPPTNGRTPHHHPIPSPPRTPLTPSPTSAFSPPRPASPPPHPPTWRLSPAKSLSVHLSQSYALCNPSFRQAPLPLGRKIARDFVTLPSEPKDNGGLDNENHELIMAVNDILVNSQGRKYVVTGLLGSGTFGIVAGCRCNDFPDEVAVKVIKNHPAYHTQARVELGVLQYLNVRMDPSDTRHIIRLHDAFYFRKHLCLVFEKLDVNLYDILRSNRHRGLSFNLIRIFCRQILDTLILLRESSPGVVHCDLKPENVMVRRKGPLAKVIDYGSSVFLGRQTPTTYIQSRFYRSPEIILGCPYGLAIDMWSFGCLAAELFLGMPLFPADTEHDLLTRQVAAFGMPPEAVLQGGKYTEKYFAKRESTQSAAVAVGATGASARPRPRVTYTLLSKEAFEAANKRSAKVGKMLWKADLLEDIIADYPFPEGLSEEAHQKERSDRECFTDFLSGVLDLNPATRWTPRQAVAHPFITLEPFRCPFNPPPDADHPTSCHDSPSAMSIASTYTSATPWLSGTPAASYPSTGLPSPHFPVQMSPLDIHARAHAIAMATVAQHLSPKGPSSLQNAPPGPLYNPHYHPSQRNAPPPNPSLQNSTHVIHGSFPNTPHFLQNFAPHSLPARSHFPLLPPASQPQPPAFNPHFFAAAAAAAVSAAQLPLGSTPPQPSFFPAPPNPYMYPPSNARQIARNPQRGLPAPPPPHPAGASASSLPQAFLTTFGLSPLDPNPHHHQTVAAAAAAAAVASMASSQHHHHHNPPPLFATSYSTAHTIPTSAPFPPPSYPARPQHAVTHPHAHAHAHAAPPRSAPQPPAPLYTPPRHVPQPMSASSLVTFAGPPPPLFHPPAPQPPPQAPPSPPHALPEPPSPPGDPNPDPGFFSTEPFNPYGYDPFFHELLLDDDEGIGEETEAAPASPAHAPLAPSSTHSGSVGSGFGSFQSLNALQSGGGGGGAAPAVGGGSTAGSSGTNSLLGGVAGSGGTHSLLGRGGASSSLHSRNSSAGQSLLGAAAGSSSARAISGGTPPSSRPPTALSGAFAGSGLAAAVPIGRMVAFGGVPPVSGGGPSPSNGAYAVLASGAGTRGHLAAGGAPSAASVAAALGSAMGSHAALMAPPGGPASSAAVPMPHDGATGGYGVQTSRAGAYGGSDMQALLAGAAAGVTTALDSAASSSGNSSFQGIGGLSLSYGSAMGMGSYPGARTDLEDLAAMLEG